MILKALLAPAFACPVLVAGAMSASAQSASRTFVSGQGNDSGACTLTAPCRSFAYALGQTASGGQLAVLNTAGYGPATITSSVAITAPAGISAQVSGNGITVNGSGIAVTLEGLDLGQGSSIVFQNGARLSLDRISVEGGTVQHNASGGSLIMNDSVMRGSTCFLADSPSSTPVYATITNSSAEGCYMGFVAMGNSYVTISHSTAAGASSTNFNVCYGAFVAVGSSTGTGHLLLEDDVASTCYYGVASGPYNTGGNGAVVFSNSVISNTNSGAVVAGSSTIATFGNNKFYFNASDGYTGSTVSMK